VDRRVAWLGEEWPGSEQVSIRTLDGGIVAGGIVLAVVEGRPLRLSYSVQCDEAWRVRSVDVEIHEGGRVHLVADGQGRWRTGSGEKMETLAGCIDVDIRATPFTNTLPIRRLGLVPGESRDLSMAFIDVPRLDVRAVEQRYTCVEASAHGGVYRFESGSFSADLTVDRDGLVIDYPGGWRRADLLDDRD
jgi:uncharacterized protein